MTKNVRRMKPLQLCVFLVLCELCCSSGAFSVNEEIVEVGLTSKFLHEVKVVYNNQTLHEERTILKVSRPDIDTLVISSQKLSKPSMVQNLKSDDDRVGSLVIRSLDGRISSILMPKFGHTKGSVNYLRSMASILFIYKETHPHSYYMVTDIFGTCEVTIMKNDSMTEVTRDLKRCSHSSNEVTNGVHFLPLFHLGFDMSGSSSSCWYQWTDPNQRTLKEVSCRDGVRVARRFSYDLEVHLAVTSTLRLKSQEAVGGDVYGILSEATESTDLILEPLHNRRFEEVDEEEVESVLRQLCAASRDHVTKEGLLLSARLFHALARSSHSTPPQVLKYPCPANVRRSAIYSAALIGGPRFLTFVHDQMTLLVDEGLELLPGKGGDPFVTVAISNLAEPNLNSRMAVPLDFFLQRENVLKMEKIIEMLLVAGGSALPGVARLLEKLRVLSPALFEDVMLRASALLSPEESCANGDAEEATRILHAVSSISVRPPSFVASLRPCFATEDVGVQVAAMMSLRTLSCDTPGVLELQQLALESPSDPEIRIAAFKGIVMCLPGRESLIKTLLAVLDPNTENFSKQVSSFVWSYVQSILASNNPNLIELRLELEDVPELIHSPDPVSYDPRRHSRHLEHVWTLDPRTSLSGTMELIWGRGSPAPRSLLAGVTLFHDGVPYDMVEIALRFTGLENAIWAIPGLRKGWTSWLRMSNDAWTAVQDNVERFWRGKRDVEEDAIRAFVQEVIARIPADFQASGSSLEVSLSLFGIPASHIYHGRIDEFFRSIPDKLDHLTKFNFHSEIFHLLPLLDNSVELGTSAGVPLSLELTSSGGVHSVLAHYTDDARGSLDFVASGGMTMETRLKIGQAETEAADVINPSDVIFNDIPETFSDISSKTVWSIDFPLSFSYELKAENKVFKFRRPSVLPHHIYQREKAALLNHKPFPLRRFSNCLFEEEVLNVCMDWSEERKHSRKLEVLNNNIFRPSFYGVKVVVPAGFEPVSLLMEGPITSPGRTVHSFKVEIPTSEQQTFSYELILLHYSTSAESFAVKLSTPLHSYYAKGYWSFGAPESWSFGVEASVDQELQAVRFEVSFPEVAHQRIITPTVALVRPGSDEEELVLRLFIVVKEFAERSSVEVTGSTQGALAEFVGIKFAGFVKSNRREDGYELNLQELKITLPNHEIISLQVELSKALIGLDSLVLMTYGTNYVLDASFSYALIDLGASVHLLPPEVRASLSGATFALNTSFKHPDFPTPASLAVSGTVDKGKAEFDIEVHYGNETGRVLFFLVYDSLLNFRSIVSVEYPSWDIVWTTTQELVWDDPNYKIGFNVSWTLNPNDHFGILLHFTKGKEYHHSFIGFIVLPGQQVDIFHDLTQAIAGSYKHNFFIKATPGREITMNTIVVAGKDPNVITYGLSIDFATDKWDNVLRIVGTANCDSTYTKCAVNVVVAQSPDQLGEFEIKYTGSAIGISRTDLKLVVQDYLDLQSSVDIVVRSGTIKSRLTSNVIPWQRQVFGIVNVNWKSSELAEAEFKVLTQGEQQVLTHYYNASFELDKESRTLYSRHELRADVDGIIHLWAAIVHGKIGNSIINENHFGKIVYATPDNIYYSISGEASSEYIERTLAIGSIILSANIGPQSTYLLGWDLNVRMNRDELGKARYLIANKDKEGGEELDMVSFTTLGRLKTPASGEVKLNVKAKRSIVFETGNSHISNMVEVRLVSETFPELGRVNAKVTHNLDSYSLAMRLWSGSRSLAVESYGISGDGSLKSSSSFTVADPSSSWQVMEMEAEGHHLGHFPHNFESSLEMVAEMRHNNLGSLSALAQWTPTTAALKFGLGAAVQYIPSCNFFFKWTIYSLQSQISLLKFKSILDVRLVPSGNKMDSLLSFSFPNNYVNDFDSTFSFYVLPDDVLLLPNIFILKGRFSVNTIKHWILNVDTKLKDRSFSVKGGIIRPLDPSSFSLEFFGLDGGAFYCKATLVLDAKSHHLKFNLKPTEKGEELSVHIQSCLFPESGGYVLHIWNKMADKVQFGITWAEGSDVPHWSCEYRLNIDYEYVKVDLLGRAFLNDSYVYKVNATEMLQKQFVVLALLLEDREERYLVDVEFPEWFPGSFVEGTIDFPSHESEVTGFFRLELPENDHILETKLTYEIDSVFNWRLGRIIYRQRLIKGIGHPLRLEVEANRSEEGHKDFEMSLQKLFTKENSLKGQSRKGESGNKILFHTLRGRLVLMETLTSKEYKLGWETDDSRNEAELILEKDSGGGGGHFRYERAPLKSPPKGKEFIILKGNVRSFPSEITCSFTLEHVSIGRARSLTFLHSGAEAYTEIVLDVFKSEEDQIIIVLNEKIEEQSLRIGQFGNTFLQVAHKSKNVSEESAEHSLLVEIGGHNLEVKFEPSTYTDEDCKRLNLIIGSPSMVPTHNAFTICHKSNIKLTLQVLGLEEMEGPYLNVGEISGPGGGGLQLGGGRLHPLDTPPALTLTGDIKESYLEILFNCQLPSMNQLMEDVYLRKSVVENALKNFPQLELQVKGILALDKALKDLDHLLDDAASVVRPYMEEAIANLDEEVYNKLRNSTEMIRQWLEKRKTITIMNLHETLNFSKQRLEEIVSIAQYWIKQNEFYVLEVVDHHFKGVKEFYVRDVWPAWIRMNAGLRAISFNDNQSLYALVSRVMSTIHAEFGRQKGIEGFLLNDILTKIEQGVARQLRWGNIRKQMLASVKIIEGITPINFKMSHDTAFKFQIRPAMRIWSDLRRAAERVNALELPNDFLVWMRSRVEAWKSRLHYFVYSEVKGSAIVLGWEQGISWDGRFLPSLLSDMCPHVLVLLTRSPTPLAVTLQVRVGRLRPFKVLTFFSRGNHVALNAFMEVLINGNQMESEDEAIGDLHVTRVPGEVRVSSSEGVSLRCFAKDDICEVELRRENFASSAGLLGVFDNEANTDFMTSAWERPPSESEWKSSWRVPSKEECLPLPLAPSLAPEEDEKCSVFLEEEDSPFKECSGAVSVRPFYEACRAGKRCGAEAAIRTECRNHFIETDHSLLSCGVPSPRLVVAASVPAFEHVGEKSNIAFECIVKADPPLTSLSYLKDGVVLKSNVSLGVMVTAQNLVLENISAPLRGNYSCLAANSHGSSVSSPIQLDFPHKPVCAHGKRTVDAIEHDLIVLECRVEANPPHVTFSWLFKNGEEEFIEFPETSFTSKGLVSKLNYIPETASDFGSIFCLARSPATGTQEEPCEYLINHQQISAASRCSDPPDERTGTEGLRHEVVFLGDFACVDALDDILRRLKEDSARPLRLVLRYTSHEMYPEAYELFDEVKASFGRSAFDLLSVTLQRDFSKDSIKAIVLANCHSRDCRPSDKEDVTNTLTLSEELRALGIQIYTITKDQIVINDQSDVPNKVKRQLLGMDRKTSYLMSHARKKNLKGKRGIRKHLSLPENNLCAEIALQSDGALFSLRVLRKLKKRSHRKMFMQLIALRIVEGQKRNYYDCRSCSCQALCHLCRQVPPFESEILDFDVFEEDDDDYFYH